VCRPGLSIQGKLAELDIEAKQLPVYRGVLGTIPDAVEDDLYIGLGLFPSSGSSSAATGTPPPLMGITHVLGSAPSTFTSSTSG
jgi:hypothetical protein